MPKPKSDNIRSVESDSQALGMQIDRGFRWACDCGRASNWSVLSASQHPRGRVITGPPSGFLTALTRDWEAHVAEVHPDHDLTFAEWSE